MKLKNGGRQGVRHLFFPDTFSSPEGPEAGPINLQEHQAEVRDRNVWFVEI
jgi:hypothetical protein